MGKIESSLYAKISERLAPEFLGLVNESPQHGLAAEAEKHFRVVAVSAAFAGLSRVERHRLVHSAVAAELADHVHALSVQAYTPEEWAAKGGKAFASPACLGGGKREGNGSSST